MLSQALCQVQEFMRRRRAEIAESLRQQEAAAREPVLRRLEARRAAALFELEQVGHPSYHTLQPLMSQSWCKFSCSFWEGDCMYALVG